MKKIGCVIVAGGVSKRFTGSGVKKQFYLYKGKPIIYWTVSRFERIKLIDRIVLVLPALKRREYNLNYWNSQNIKKICKVVCGGKMRQDSVYNGLKHLKNCEIILIHDGVRPLFSERLVLSVISATLKYGACVPVIKPADTIKELDKKSYIKRTINRDKIGLAQTPQGFKNEIIFDAYQRAIKENIIGTDDAYLVEKAGYKVKAIEGEPNNIKITYNSDIKFLKNIS